MNPKRKDLIKNCKGVILTFPMFEALEKLTEAKTTYTFARSIFGRLRWLHVPTRFY